MLPNFLNISYSSSNISYSHSHAYSLGTMWVVYRDVVNTLYRNTDTDTDYESKQDRIRSFMYVINIVGLTSWSSTVLQESIAIVDVDGGSDSSQVSTVTLPYRYA